MGTCKKDGFCVSPRTEREIQNVAEQLRKVLTDNSEFKHLDIVRILEHKMPEAFPGFRYEIISPSEMPDREAEMNPFEFCIRIQEPVYRKAMEGDGHCRFTIAHELGHFFLHRTQALAFGRKAKDGNIPTFQNSEWQADVFARNLLAPYSMTRDMDAGAIEVLFGVSHSVARIIAGQKKSASHRPVPPCGMYQMTFPF